MRRRHARRQAGGHRDAARLRGQHQRDERRPQAPERPQGGRLAAGVRGSPRSSSFIISDVVSRSARRHRLRADRRLIPPPSPGCGTSLDQADRLLDRVPAGVREHIDRGICGLVAETPKAAAGEHRRERDPRQQRPGPGRRRRDEAHRARLSRRSTSAPSIEGRDPRGSRASALAGIVRSVRADGVPVRLPRASSPAATRRR